MRHKIIVEERSHDRLSEFEWWHQALRFATIWLMGGSTLMVLLLIVLKIIFWDLALSEWSVVLAPVTLLVIVNIAWFGYMVRVRIERKPEREEPS